MVKSWRDHQDDVNDLPGMYLGETDTGKDTGAAARRLYEAGARSVRVDATVRVSPDCGERSVQALTFIRDMTALGVRVRWRFAPGSERNVLGYYGHLHPPAEIVGRGDGDRLLSEWRSDFFICKCVHRNGPGFVQVRDRRPGSLHLLTVDEPGYISAVDQLIPGVRADLVEPEVLDDFRAERLVASVGNMVWWLPYRVRRWPLPSMTV